MWKAYRAKPKQATSRKHEAKISSARDIFFSPSSRGDYVHWREMQFHLCFGSCSLNFDKFKKHKPTVVTL